jgi:hypothetical protein
VTIVSTEDNSTEGSTADNMRKAMESLDRDGGGAPSSEYLEEVDPDEFGHIHETNEEEGGDGESLDDEDMPPDSPSTDR